MVEEKNISTEFPGQVHHTPGGGILVSKMDKMINWARRILYGHWFLAPVAVLLK